MQSKLVDYMAKAQTVLADPSNGIVVNGNIHKAYKGYVASFGASVVISGLLPTLAFYLRSEAQTDGDRSHVVAAIAKMLGFTSSSALFDEAMMHRSNQDEAGRILRNISLATTALKLAMRTYPFV